jgi:hypothetical protein
MLQFRLPHHCWEEAGPLGAKRWDGKTRESIEAAGEVEEIQWGSSKPWEEGLEIRTTMHCSEDIQLFWGKKKDGKAGKIRGIPSRIIIGEFGIQKHLRRNPTSRGEKKDEDGRQDQRISSGIFIGV